MTERHMFKQRTEVMPKEKKNAEADKELKTRRRKKRLLKASRTDSKPRKCRRQKLLKATSSDKDLNVCRER